MFLDRVILTIKAGDGGNGSTSFFRSKLVMYGGPDGGDGGNGGSIIFIADEGLNTLYSVSLKKKYIATNGNNGEKQLKRGHDGEDVIIKVPCGTVIKDYESGLVIADLMNNNETFVALKGGRGGKGNNYFKSPTRQSPHFAQTGEKTEAKKVILELKTIADVGLVGFPNAGKSTLLSVISNANPKIANYPFTTLHPNLGVVNHLGTSFVVADIPGLIEGASEGAGLGHYFLRHVERVRVIIHMVDISESDCRDAVEDYLKINEELKKYSEDLAHVPQIVVATKADLLDEETLKMQLENFEQKTKIMPLVLSAVTHKGLDNLLNEVVQKLSKTPKKAPIQIEMEDFDTRDKSSFEVIRHDDGAFEVLGGFIDHFIRGIVLSDEVSNAYFQNALKKFGIIDKLKQAGMKDGDTVIIKDIVFEYSE